LKLNSLKFKILFWFIGSITLVLLAFSFALYYSINENINLKHKAKLDLIAQNVLDELNEEDIKELFSNIENAQVAILKDEKILYQTDNFKFDSFKKFINTDKTFFVKKLDEEINQGFYIYKFDEPFIGQILLTNKQNANKLEDIVTILLVLNPILLIFLIYIGIKFFNKMLTPVNDITEAAKKISINNFTHNLEIDKQDDEFKELIKTFNLMINRLQDGVEKLDKFNSDVSHELRTPLTVINTQIELALKKQRDENYYQNSLKKISYESNKIKEIVENLLLLTKYSKENIDETFEMHDLNSILIDSVEKLLPLAKKKNISIEFARFEKAREKVNPLLINVLFSNIIENAIKYSNTDKKIYISIYKENDSINFIVEDQGIGISEKYINQITDRFFRVDESRNKSIKGFGLGLSLVKNIVELHKGELDIKSKPSIGTKITVTFDTFKV